MLCVIHHLLYLSNMWAFRSASRQVHRRAGCCVFCLWGCYLGENCEQCLVLGPIGTSHANTFF
jgi:hypothetical protein